MPGAFPESPEIFDPMETVDHVVPFQCRKP